MMWGFSPVKEAYIVYRELIWSLRQWVKFVLRCGDEDLDIWMRSHLREGELDALETLQKMIYIDPNVAYRVFLDAVRHHKERTDEK